MSQALNPSHSPTFEPLSRYADEELEVSELRKAGK